MYYWLLLVFIRIAPNHEPRWVRALARHVYVQLLDATTEAVQVPHQRVETLAGLEENVWRLVCRLPLATESQPFLSLLSYLDLVEEAFERGNYESYQDYFEGLAADLRYDL